MLHLLQERRQSLLLNYPHELLLVPLVCPLKATHQDSSIQGLLTPLFHMLLCLPDNKIPNPRPLNPKYTDLPHRNRNHIRSRYLFLSLFSPQSTFLPLDYRNPQLPPILAFLHYQAPLQPIPPPSHTPMLLLHHSQSLRVEFQLLRVDTSRTPLLSDLRVIA